ncbi:MAG TPA: cyclopropane-fatty-acyl-phospholipid synthase family protein [Gemmatimonadales bacterium]|nr:cyclopropane-fatty-acyl-phospholipid synthase family protein [Gemmatimonadales bacterium]
MGPLSSSARRALAARLGRLRHGRLTLREGGVVTSWGDPAAEPVVIDVHDARFHSAVALGGAVGAGEAYAEGWWATDDLTGLVRLLLRERDVLDGLETGAARLVQPVRRLLHALNRNSRRGARRNILAHYDLGNEFFGLFLDDTLTYSCALFERPGASLHDASTAKYERIADLLELQASDHLVEIGTGWGGFAIHAASTRGCRVTTTTISDEQFRLATARVAAAGLADRVEVLRRDYRDLTGTYDKLASIEMIEAVGHEHYGGFFAKCAELLAPHGRAAIQAITIDDARYEGARREVDFIKRYIFPGSCIPSRAVLRAAAAPTDLALVRVDEMGHHYAETLRRWRMNLEAQRTRALALGFDERFLRLWEFYFCYCEGGFLERAIGTAQMAFAKPAAVPAAPRDVAPIPGLGAAA